jgi:acyl-CoA synthetase (AMP-forming)/AMP-acid ligase II
MPGVELRIAGPDGTPLPPGETGEVWLRGYNVMRGYLGDAAATANALDPQGWLHTGDIGSLDAGGNLRVTDRIKDMFIVGGFNCYPAEIERLFAAHEAVAQIAVVGVPDERLGEVGHAWIVLRAGVHTDAETLAQWARRNMANYKVPRRIEIVTALPTSAAGKVLKYRLREAFAQGVSA